MEKENHWPRWKTKNLGLTCGAHVSRSLVPLRGTRDDEKESDTYKKINWKVEIGIWE
jgi:hypothetical protein